MRHAVIWLAAPVAAFVIEVATSVPAWSTDFTFTVPVSVSHLPSNVISMTVWCNVQTSPTSPSAGAVIGQGNTTVPISSGAYHGDVTVGFNVTAGHDPATAARYGCGGFFISSDSIPIFYFHDYTAPTFPLQPGAPFVLSSFGDLPP